MVITSSEPLSQGSRLQQRLAELVRLLKPPEGLAKLAERPRPDIFVERAGRNAAGTLASHGGRQHLPQRVRQARENDVMAGEESVRFHIEDEARRFRLTHACTVSSDGTA